MTNGITFIAGGPAEPVVKDRTSGEVATDRDSGKTMHQVHLTAFVPGDPKPQVWPVKVAGEVPPIKQGQAVRVEGLTAADWEVDGRSGVAFRAQSIGPVQQGRA
jgi:hypothetical protein